MPSSRMISANGIDIFLLEQGEGPLVVLCHGWPELSYSWRHQIPAIAAAGFHVVAPDMRGFGRTSAPSDVNAYSIFDTVGDMVALVAALDKKQAVIVGHDWGAPVAFRLAADHPEAVTRLVILDTPIPGDQPSNTGFGGPPRWHHLFHNVPDLPEALTAGRERIYLEFLYMNGIDRAGTFSDADIAEYVRTYSQPGAMRAGFNFYRAIRQDADDNRATLATGFKLPMPALALGGGGSRGRGELVIESLRRVALHAEGGSIADCGHFIPEEMPEELARRLREFLSR